MTFDGGIKNSQQGSAKMLRCPYCGTTAEDYFHTGLVGCSACYKFLLPAIQKSIESMQGTDVHIGKRPLKPNEHTVFGKEDR